jgi:hypothetical protein
MFCLQVPKYATAINEALRSPYVDSAGVPFALLVGLHG